MCGRFALTRSPDDVRTWFSYRDQPNFPPRYNVAPTQPVPVVLRDQGERRFILMRWGFLPGFVKDPKDYPLVINVRSETVREKASFRSAFLRRRGLIPADGFYEWQAVGKVKRPFLIRRPDRGLFAFAALFETWSSPDGSEIDTVAIMTTHANGTLAAVHERSPVVLGQADIGAWLDPALTPGEAEAMLKPPPDDFFELVPVGAGVNSVANDNPSLQQRVDTLPAPPAKSRKPPDDAQGSLF